MAVITLKEYRALLANGAKPIIHGAKPLPARTTAKVEGMFESKLERDYAKLLDMRKRAGEITDWMYEPMKLRLADGTYYTPDFLIHENDGSITIDEAKGFMREAARVRLNVAADKYRFFRFRLVKRGDRGSFNIRDVR